MTNVTFAHDAWALGLLLVSVAMLSRHVGGEPWERRVRVGWIWIGLSVLCAGGQMYHATWSPAAGTGCGNAAAVTAGLGLLHWLPGLLSEEDES